MSNVFNFIGTVGRDAEVRYTPSGAAVLNVNVANNIGFGDKQQTLWVRVAVWGKRAEGQLVDYLKKGQQVFVSGELSMQEYKANDGSMKTALILTANILDLIGKRSEGGAPAEASGQGNKSAPANPATRQASQEPPPQDNFDDFDDDIPF